MGPTNEFSRRVVIEPWPEGGIAVELLRRAGRAAALARRFGLLGLHALTARGRLERVAGSREIRFSGWLEAALEQECVVSLEPVPAQLRQPVERRYAAGARRMQAPAGPAVLVADEDDEDEVELVERPHDRSRRGVRRGAGAGARPLPARAGGRGAGRRGSRRAAVSFGAVAEPAEQPFAVLRRLEEKHAR